MDILGTLSSVLSGGTTTLILKLVLAAIVGIAVFFFYRWLNKQKVDQAHAETQKDRATQQGQIDDQNRDMTKDGQDSEKSIEDLIAQRKKNDAPKLDGTH